MRGKESSEGPRLRGTHLQVLDCGGGEIDLRMVLGLLVVGLEWWILWTICGVGGVEGDDRMALVLFMIGRVFNEMVVRVLICAPTSLPPQNNNEEKVRNWKRETAKGRERTERANLVISVFLFCFFLLLFLI